MKRLFIPCWILFTIGKVGGYFYFMEGINAQLTTYIFHFWVWGNPYFYFFFSKVGGTKKELTPYGLALFYTLFRYTVILFIFLYTYKLSISIFTCYPCTSTSHTVIKYRLPHFSISLN